MDSNIIIDKRIFKTLKSDYIKYKKMASPIQAYFDEYINFLDIGIKCIMSGDGYALPNKYVITDLKKYLFAKLKYGI
jgi:hypothetical protein